ncbi:MAG: acylphosphatase [Bacteroidales bacterium]|jgi:acylphosphatase
MRKGFSIQVYGRVQGVGFRYGAMQKARQLEIAGYVHNKVNGSVYIEAEGEYEALLSFLAWCKEGPSGARVEDVQWGEVPLSNYKHFSVRG